MSISIMTLNSTEIRPWGRAVGLVTGCAVTLVGVVTNVSPHVIAMRAVVSGVLVGSLAAFAARLVRNTGEGRR